ncbi:MAG: hypothetical protein KJ069_24445 [Anaerolineae bacterium]|nr:hypothetical protein [Anaerolineae bacterium]
MVLRLTVVFLVILLALVACGSEPPTAATEVDFATVCDEANEGNRVAVQGYLRLPDSFTGEESVVLRLFAGNDFSGTPIGATAKLGNEANQAEQVPTSYTDNDLKVHLADGQVTTYGTRVKVSGKVYYPLVDQDFVCGLENLYIEAGN